VPLAESSIMCPFGAVRVAGVGIAVSGSGVEGWCNSDLWDCWEGGIDSSSTLDIMRA
jgi:hypothetical protein